MGAVRAGAGAKRGAAAGAMAAALVAAGMALWGCLGGPGAGRKAAAEAEGRVFPEDLAGAPALAEEAFRVVEYAPRGVVPWGVPPRGVVPWENLEGGLWALFSRPVVSLGELGKPMRASPVMQLYPAVEGTWRWYGSRLLSFEPAGALDPAVEYTAAIDPKLRGLDGSRLEGMNAFHFRTPPLQLQYLDPSGSDVPPENCRVLELQLNYPVELPVIERYLRVEAGGRSYPFTISYAPQAQAGVPGLPEGSVPELPGRRLLRLSLSRELPWDEDVQVRLLPGARPGPQSYGTEEEQSLGFHTLLPLALERSELYDWLPSLEAALIFNHPLSEEGVAQHVLVELLGYDVGQNLEVSGPVVYLRGLPAAFESSFQVRLLPGLQDLYGQKLAQQTSLTLEVGPAPSYVRFRASGDRILEAGFPPVVAVEFENVSSGSYAAGRLAEPYQELPEQLAFTDYGVQQLPRNARLFRLLDLSPFLGEGGLGSVFARFRFTVPYPWAQKPYPVEGELRLQVSGLGFTTHLACNRLLLRVASLESGEAVAGAEVTLTGPEGVWRRGRSDAAGLVSLELEPGQLARLSGPERESLQLEVRKGRDRLVFRPARAPSLDWNFHGPFTAESPRPVTYLCSDRGVYRPGETLSFYGIDRDLLLGKLQERQGACSVALRQGWSRDSIRARWKGRLSASGRFWGSVELPASLEPDEYYLVYSREDGRQTRSVPVRLAFFRPVSFSVELELPEGIHYMGENLQARFSGRYLAGGALNRGRWRAWWARRTTSYQPPDPEGAYRGFQFGVPPGYGYQEDSYDEYGGYYEELSSHEGSLGGDGVVATGQALSDGRPGQVYEYTVTATVEDIDRQAISQQASALVFTSSLLLGARLSESAEGEESLYFVRAKEPFFLQLAPVGPDGSAYAPSGLEVKGRLLREEWKMVRERSIGGEVDTRWVREEIEEGSFALKPPGRRDSRGRYLAAQALRTGRVGSYIVELGAADRQGRGALTRLHFYSTGSANVLWRRYDESRIELVPDRPLYSPGERARLLIKSPLEGGSYLLTVEREGILEERVLELSGSTDTAEVELREEHVPVVYVTLTSFTGRTAPPPDSPDLPDLGKPRGCFGSIALPVDTESRRIELRIVKSRSSYRPGDEAEITVRATWQGRPLEGAEIALVGADRSVLDLVDYHLPDPLALFYDLGNYPQGVAHYDTRALLMDPVLWKVRDLPGGDKEGEPLGAGLEGGFPVRRDFRATAVFDPGLVTDGEGKATVRFRLPDQLTTFRLTAVAARGELFGLAEEELLVQNPINVRAALPRQLRVGDRVEAGVVVTNLDRVPHEVSIGLEAGLLTLEERSQKRVRLPAGESREVAFRLSAPEPGAATLRFEVEGEVLQERLEVPLPVRTSAIPETFTIVGQTEQAAQEGLELPARFLEERLAGASGEGLYLSLDSTLASSLVEAIRFLELYPYDCLEQRTSKLFAYVLYDWLLPNPSVLPQELAALAPYQTEEGGFTFWAAAGYRVPNYYVSLRTAHLLHLAEERGYELPPGLDQEALLRYLQRSYEQQREQGPKRSYLQCYALYVLSLYGYPVGERALELLADGQSPGLAGKALLGLTLQQLGAEGEARRVLDGLRNTLRVGTRSVTLAEQVEGFPYYSGQLQAKALLLMLYAALEPRSQIAQALAEDLLAGSRRGYWQNTSNTGWVLQAFASYMQADSELQAEFQARVRLGDTVLAQASFSGPSRVPFTARVAPEALRRAAGPHGARAEGAVLPLSFEKQGRGRLYYAASLRYLLDPLAAEARDEGIGLYTEILDTQGEAVGGTLKLGQVYRFHAVLSSSRDRDFLALRLPLPSGAEAIDASLAVSEILRGQAEEEGYYGPVKRVYDEEVRFFFDRFPRGKGEVSFLFRATTPGTFPTPPAMAELMYQEEVFGRTAGREYRIVR